MGFWSRTFTWWNGATWGTRLWTWRHGTEVGRDDQGNIYYQGRKNPASRWVIYNGANDGSRVPPDWQAWLKGTIEELPEKALPPRRKFEKPPQINPTGTLAAFRPGGSLQSKSQLRPTSTGDYQAWTPD
jgi:NADH:ubiquinone oxidoreductase subunit